MEYSCDTSILSWGRAIKAKHQGKPLAWLGDLEFDYEPIQQPLIAYGLGRSYGDCCLNDGGILLLSRGLKRLISFDQKTGILRCESGVSLGEIIRVLLPRGWFPPVLPGTKNVTVGGAIANDIHGKNHHVAGSFGSHVIAFGLKRSDGRQIVCSKAENEPMFRATIGGIGLTGFITWVELQLKRVASAKIVNENIRFGSLTDYFVLSDEAEAEFEYTVAWIDSTARGSAIGRGIFMRGNHARSDGEDLSRMIVSDQQALQLPLGPPFNLMSCFVTKQLNNLFYRKHFKNVQRSKQLYESYFFPLDRLANWNLAYGPKGFHQIQFVVPKTEQAAIKEILRYTSEKTSGSFVSVLKTFGDAPSPGMMSFPKAGYTLTLDFPNGGKNSQRIMLAFEQILKGTGAKVYAAKDALCSAEFFQQGYEQIDEFRRYIDPKFSSSFWRRVNHE